MIDKEFPENSLNTFEDFYKMLLYTWMLLTLCRSSVYDNIFASSEEWGWLVRCQITQRSLTLVHHHLFLIIPSYIILYSYVHVRQIMYYTSHDTEQLEIDGNKIWPNDKIWQILTESIKLQVWPRQLYNSLLSVSDYIRSYVDYWIMGILPSKFGSEQWHFGPEVTYSFNGL